MFFFRHISIANKLSVGKKKSFPFFLGSLVFNQLQTFSSHFRQQKSETRTSHGWNWIEGCHFSAQLGVRRPTAKKLVHRTSFIHQGHYHAFPILGRLHCERKHMASNGILLNGSEGNFFLGVFRCNPRMTGPMPFVRRITILSVIKKVSAPRTSSSQWKESRVDFASR